MLNFLSSRALLAGLAAVTLATAAGLAAAQGADSERAQKMVAQMQKRFAAADANGDGKLTKAEANGKMRYVYQHFDEIDAGRSGYVTLADIGQYARSQRAARGK